MSNRNKVSVRIYHQEYTMTGNESKEYMLKVANYVDEKMTHIAEKSRKLSTSMIAVLTALNIADEYLKMQSELERVQEESQKPLEELEQTRKRLEELEEAAMEPLQELERTRNQLAATIQEFEMKEAAYKEIIQRMEEENKQILDENKNTKQFMETIKQLEEELQLKDIESQKSRQTNRKLQNKLTEIQNKYNQVKNELEAFIEAFDEEKST